MTMSDWVSILLAAIGLLGAFGGYVVGMSSAMKDIEIEKIKTERDMYEQRLREWNENQKNI